MSDGPLLVIEESGEVHRLYIHSAVFGRSKTCDLAFDRPGVSRRHCEIVLRPGGALVRDLGSSHGTYLDGHRVHGESTLRRGQTVRLGPRGPRLRVMEAHLGNVDAMGDEPTQFIAMDPPTQAIGSVPRTETALPPVHPSPTQPSPAEPPTSATQPIAAATPKTVVAAVPRHPQAPATPPGAAPPIAELASPARQSSFGADLALGLMLGFGAGIILLVAIDLSPLREMLALG